LADIKHFSGLGAVFCSLSPLALSGFQEKAVDYLLRRGMDADHAVS
jgi:hypothetical protein